MAAIPINKRQGRYEIRKILAEGGMGRVYVAFDSALKREVALKTIRDMQDKTVLSLFRRECDVLAQMAHPNIVEIFDIGETEEKEPYFVMPLLRGVTLDNLIRESSPRLTVERCVQMIGQVCRGLQAAHDQGLIHRDLKPGNLFVLEDDSVKIIDFGVAHLNNQRSSTGLKGTLLYMSPEQLQMKKLEPWSDQFSLAVISYEMLTRRHPFASVGRDDLPQAILTFSPPPASEINNLIPPAVSQVIHKAFAKDQFNRFANVREYADCLQKALRGEPIEFFNPEKIEPRLIRAKKALADGDLDFAAEITRELRSESYLSPEIDRLDTEIAHTIRTKSVKQLLETAQRRFEEKEYVLALQKVQEVLNFDPQNTEAHTMKASIEGKRGAAQVEDWFRLAHQHVENNAFSHARQALEKMLELRPKDIRAEALLVEVNRREQEFNRLRTEKQQAYQAALAAYERGDVKSALSKLERVLELDRRAPHITSPDHSPAYQKLYQEVRSKNDELKSLADTARKHISDGNFQGAFSICDGVLASSPNDVTFKTLRENAEQLQRQEISAYVANVEKEVWKEPDLNRRVSILEEAKAKYPMEPRFDQALQQARSRKELVDSIMGTAHSFEDAGQFNDALSQWERMRDIHPQYPGLDVELERLRRRREDQTKSEVKAGWILQIDQAMAVHNHARALPLIEEALGLFPSDPELLALQKSTKHFLELQQDAQQKLVQGKELDQAGKTKEALTVLREAFKIDPHNLAIRNGLIDLLLKNARTFFEKDWKEADPFVKEASELEPANPLAKSLRKLIQEKKQSGEVDQFLSKTRELQGEGKLPEAVAELDKGLAVYPKDSRLIQLRGSLVQGMSPADRSELRTRDLGELKKLEKEAQTQTDQRQLGTIFEKTRIYGKYQDDPEFRSPLTAIEEKCQKSTTGAGIHVPQPVIPAAPRLQPASQKAGTTLNWRYWAIGGLAGVVTIIPLIYLWLKEPSPTPTPAKVAQVSVTIKEQGDSLRVEDTQGQDVSAILLDPGLDPGSYKIKATRKGFVALESSFTIKPGEQNKEVLLKWDNLPTLLVFRRFPLNSEIEINQEPLKHDASGTLERSLRSGAYTISSKVPFPFELELVVADGKVKVRNWKQPPNFSMLVTKRDAKSASFESFGYLQNIFCDGKPFKDKGELPVISGDKFEIQTFQRGKLSEFPELPAEFSSAIYLDLPIPVAQPRGPVTAAPTPNKAKEPIPTKEGAPQVAQPQTQPPQSSQPTPEQREDAKKAQQELDKLLRKTK